MRNLLESEFLSYSEKRKQPTVHSTPFEFNWKTTREMFQDSSAAAAPSLPSQTQWTRELDKLFERAIYAVPENTPNRWERVAECVPGKTADEVRERYEDLLRDLAAIESGRVEIPVYPEDMAAAASVSEGSLSGWDSAEQISFGSKNKHGGDTERKKGTPWTEDEHKRFLKGLREYGKGDWRSISRNVVITRTPTQVASHAQKYFLRQNAAKKERKRSSIHDITTVDSNPVSVPMDQGWIAPPPPPPPSFPAQQSQEMHQFNPQNHFHDQFSPQKFHDQEMHQFNPQNNFHDHHQKGGFGYPNYCFRR